MLQRLFEVRWEDYQTRRDNLIIQKYTCFHRQYHFTSKQIILYRWKCRLKSTTREQKSTVIGNHKHLTSLVSCLDVLVVKIYLGESNVTSISYSSNRIWAGWQYKKYCFRSHKFLAECWEVQVVTICVDESNVTIFFDLATFLCTYRCFSKPFFKVNPHIVLLLVCYLPFKII